jgi:heme exporter protein A
MRWSAMTTALLSAERLDVSRGDRVLLSGLQLNLEPGSLVHLRGRNGAGKTSLLEVLAGLRRPSAGVVNGAGPEAVHWIGHRNALNPDLDAEENLRYWCAVQGVPDGGLAAALDRMGLTRLRRRTCRRMSAGQKRRVSLCRLLMVQRPLWLLDEPLSGLDGAGLQLFGALLNEHLEQGGAAVVTSHQPLPGRYARLTVLELG